MNQTFLIPVFVSIFFTACGYSCTISASNSSTILLNEYFILLGENQLSSIAITSPEADDENTMSRINECSSAYNANLSYTLTHPVNILGHTHKSIPAL